ncbi:EamA family transporter [Actinopolymorpha singaporensis]|uniref:EamA family transporter n=1 Tax=Actinopolymorpha singaporensis TaxID=117157 RepID=UPI0018D279C9|nr:EamA family transporter [Actinopolymorpha singaporensis]
MIGAVLALGSAACFGLADYVGGLLTRRANATSVAFTVQASGALVVLAGLAVTASDTSDTYGTCVAALGWGALSGVGTAVGVLFLYKGMAGGPMSVVVPLSTMGGVVLPVLVGVTLLSEKPSPSAWVGIVLAVPAIALVCAAGGSGTRVGRAAVVAALVSSVGFALQYVALAQAGSSAGLWPVAAGRVASMLTMVVSIPVAKWMSQLRSAPETAPGSAPESQPTRRSPLKLPPRLALAAAGNGILAAAGLTLYLAATGQTSMSVAVVLSSLYPVVPVLLGVVVLRERLTRRQVAGLATAAVTVVLVTAG